MSYEIRLARRPELDLLGEIELDAGQLFAEYIDVPDDVSTIAELQHAWERNHVWVAVSADGRLMGFAYGTEIDGNFHLEEISVRREFGRRGVGRVMVEGIARDAAREGYPAVTLTTFRHIPWNAPFYARLGFRVLQPGELTPNLERAFHAEESRGLRLDLRVVMCLDLAAD